MEQDMIMKAIREFLYEKFGNSHSSTDTLNYNDIKTGKLISESFFVTIHGTEYNIKLTNNIIQVKSHHIIEFDHHLTESGARTYGDARPLRVQMYTTPQNITKLKNFDLNDPNSLDKLEEYLARPKHFTRKTNLGFTRSKIFNPIICIIYNTIDETYHPVIMIEHPLPSRTVWGDPHIPPFAERLTRHLNKVHHTKGFPTKDEANENCIELMGQLELTNPHIVGTISIRDDIVFEWDGQGIPNITYFFESQEQKP